MKKSVSIRYVGVNPVAGRREYGFEVEDAEVRRVVVAVRDTDFSSRQLSFQEAPDLCYQKLRAEIEAERSLGAPLWITPEDLARYRETHEHGRSQRMRGSRQSSA